MTSPANITALSEPINFQKVTSRPIHPLSDDILQTPLADNATYSKTIEADFCFKNLVVINGDFYDDMDLVDEEMGIIGEKSSQSPDYLDKKATAAEEYGKSLLMWCTSIPKQNYSDFSGASKLLRDYIEAANNFIPYMIFTLSAGAYLEDRIKDLLSENENPGEAVLTMTLPDRPNLQWYEQKDFLEMLLRNPHPSDAEIDEHLAQYKHIGFRWGIAPSWTRADIQARVAETPDPKSAYEKFISDDERMKKTSSRMLDDIKADAELRDLVALAKRYVWLRTYRSDTISFSLAYLGEHLDRYFQAHGFKQNDYQFFTIEDILGGVELSQEEIDARKDSFSVIILNCKKYYLAGKDSQSYQDFLDAKVAVHEEICGAVANRPVAEVIGKVRVIVSPSELGSVEEGDIIVATMTTPNFVPAMKKAAAFVTDEGGILCHAAIISRELGKPCIVGTKNATKMLKTGDLVRLDMMIGEVHKRT